MMEKVSIEVVLAKKMLNCHAILAKSPIMHSRPIGRSNNVSVSLFPPQNK